VGCKGGVQGWGARVGCKGRVQGWGARVGCKGGVQGWSARVECKGGSGRGRVAVAMGGVEPFKLSHASYRLASAVAMFFANTFFIWPAVDLA
jgi:hypothetical protein